MHGCVFQNHVPEFGEDQKFLIFVIKNYTLHFTLVRTFSFRGAENRKNAWILGPHETNSSI